MVTDKIAGSELDSRTSEWASERFKFQLIKKSAKSDRAFKIETDTCLLTRLSHDDGRPFELLSQQTDALDERHFSYYVRPS